MADEPVQIVSVRRRMRGASQSFLVDGSDGYCYVAKFMGNPQGHRVLINEVLANHLLSALQVKTPPAAILRLTNDCHKRAELFFQTQDRVGIESGLHFGSRCPVDPDEALILDFLPQHLSPKVGNLDELGIVFAFDRWVSHRDSRQLIYAREPGSKAVLTCWPIDNGHCFAGDWDFKSKWVYLPNRYERGILSSINLEEKALKGVSRIESLSQHALVQALKLIPEVWLKNGEAERLDVMLTQLQKRQGLVRDEMAAYLAAIVSVDQAA